VASILIPGGRRLRPVKNREKLCWGCKSKLSPLFLLGNRHLWLNFPPCFYLFSIFNLPPRGKKKFQNGGVKLESKSEGSCARFWFQISGDRGHWFCFLPANIKANGTLRCLLTEVRTRRWSGPNCDWVTRASVKSASRSSRMCLVSTAYSLASPWFCRTATQTWAYCFSRSRTALVQTPTVSTSSLSKPSSLRTKPTSPHSNDW